MAAVVISGIGLVTLLGSQSEEILDRILGGQRAIRLAPFAGSACKAFAPIADFDAAAIFPENKTLRLMNRDAQMAVVASRLALRDSQIVPGVTYPAEEIALFGSTGLSGVPPTEIVGLLQHAAAPDGSLDLSRFGDVALRKIRPVLSFKILANMPICFVSIFENLRGPNAVYTPWEGQGAQAIAAGIRAVGDGDVPCAVVGGCDVKTHALSFLSLEQHGLFDSWRSDGVGSAPSEGAAFLVLEERCQAEARGACIYASVTRHSFGSLATRSNRSATLADVLRSLDLSRGVEVISSCDGNPELAEAEQTAMQDVGLVTDAAIMPKLHLGNVFAAAAAVQLALAAALARRRRHLAVLANCFGHGSEQAAFVLEGPCAAS